jgi:hypothetical protein
MEGGDGNVSGFGNRISPGFGDLKLPGFGVACIEFGTLSGFGVFRFSGFSIVC